jgi:cyanobactin maturation PatA/PatG family protease
MDATLAETTTPLPTPPPQGGREQTECLATVCANFTGTRARHIEGLRELQSETLGDRRILVAVLDGPVDRGHPCFEGAELSGCEELPEVKGKMLDHGTHVASILFGQPDGPLQGVAPGCTGLLIPVFNDERLLSQLDLSRAIETAVEAGAHVINISGGQLTEVGEAEDWLQRAVRHAGESGVLIVAAAGNDGCDCLHVPAALPTVLAVGAMDDQGRPLDFSNWGENYQVEGVLAPGKDIPGAVAGGGIAERSGTSVATPIVAGVAALLLSREVQAGRKPDTSAVRRAILKSVDPCDPEVVENSSRCLAGRLNIGAAMSEMTQETGLLSSGKECACDDKKTCTCGGVGGKCTCGASVNEATSNGYDLKETAMGLEANGLSTNENDSRGSAVANNNHNPREGIRAQATVAAAGVVEPSQVGGGLVYVLGTLGYDFGTEARRDSFKQLMEPLDVEGIGQVPSNPYDARQMVAYLRQHPSEAKALIWTLNLELTAIYAIRPEGSFAQQIYGTLVDLLAGQIVAETDPGYLERVSVPGYLTGGSVKLFSGQLVPEVGVENLRGIYGWPVSTLIEAVTDGLARLKPEPGAEAADPQALRDALRGFLDRVYYDLRNLGVTSADRALNFAATNAFQAATAFSGALLKKYELDTITVERSPFCRIDSDCWDVVLKFFNPENVLFSKLNYRFTVDVSDPMPVTLGSVRRWSSSN